MFSYNLIYMKFSWIHNIIRHNTTRYSSRHSVKCDKNQNYGDKNCILSAFCNTRSSHCVNWTSCKKLNIFKWGGRVNNPDNFYIGFLIIKKAIKTFFTVILRWREGRGKLEFSNKRWKCVILTHCFPQELLRPDLYQWHGHWHVVGSWQKGHTDTAHYQFCWRGWWSGWRSSGLL